MKMTNVEKSRWRISSDSENEESKDSPAALPIMFKGVRASRPNNICVLCDKGFSVWKDLFNHLTTAEPGINIFTCLKCSNGFLSWTALRDHERDVHYSSKNAEFTKSMLDIIGHVMVCCECGVHVVVISNPFGIVKTNYDSLKEHCSGDFRKLSFYSWSTSVKEYLGKCSVPKALNIRIKFIPYMSKIPLKCKECLLENTNYDQIEEHSVLNHSSECIYKSCGTCQKNFATDFTFETHTMHNHTSERYFLLEFLSDYPNSEPFEAAGLRPSDRLPCDLCGRNVPVNEFNKHDCAVNYTRRMELYGLLVKCPSVILGDCSINLSVNNNKLTSSIGKKFTKSALVTLKYKSVVELERLNEMKSKEYWSCKCCEFICDKSHTFANHLTNFHQLKLQNVNWPDKGFLQKYGDILFVSDDGVVCPKTDCSAIFCSIRAIEWHLQLKHKDEFVHLGTLVRTKPDVIVMPSLPSMSTSLTSSETVQLASQRKKTKLSSSTMSISNVFSLAGSPKPSSVAKPLPPSRSQTSSANEGTTVLLHPPPIPNMKPGIYNFVVTRKTTTDGTKIISSTNVGMFKSLDHNGVTYTIDKGQIEALVKVANNGLTKFAVGCIPSNYKLPEGLKIPPLPVLPIAPLSDVVVSPTFSFPSSTGSVLQHPPVPEPPSAHWECPICSIKSSNVVFLRNHLKETHTHLCSNCGCCFVTAENERSHAESHCCKSIPPNTIYFCTKCSVAFVVLRDYYAHLIDIHQADVSFDDTTGQIYPSCSFIQSSFANVTGVSNVPVADVVDKSNLDSEQANANADLDDISIVEENVSSKRKADDTVNDDNASKRAATSAEVGKNSSVVTEMDDSETSSSCSSDLNDEANKTNASDSTVVKLPDTVLNDVLSNQQDANCNQLVNVSVEPKSGTSNDDRPPNKSSAELVFENDDVKVIETKSEPDCPSFTAVKPERKNVIDDEIEIISSDDEDTPGTSSSVDRKNIPCSMCSRMFRTQRAVEEHSKTHLYDAGSTSELSFPVPFNKDVWVCRLCCLAYESFQTFDTHVKKHGNVLACTNCTAVSLSMDLLQTHLNAHNTQKLVFGCTFCHTAMRSEKNLLLHMQYEHSSHLIWNCQKCSRANTDWSSMARHVAQDHKQDYYNVTSIVLPCAHCKLHYQPENNADYKNPVAMEDIIVGECPHRTFSAYSETLVGCPKCGSMIPATKFLLENEELRKEGQFKLFLVEELVEKKEEARHPMFTKPTNNSPQFPIFQNTAIKSILNKPAFSAANKILAQTVSSTGKIVTTTNVSYASSPPVMSKLIATSSTSNYCPICKLAYTSQAALKVHLMKHDTVNVVFCLECGFSSKSSNDFFTHLLDHHGSKIKSNVLCVCQNCGENINDLDTFLKHQHLGLHKCETCGLPNYSMEAHAEHMGRHQKYGVYCCAFCSACFFQSKALEVHKIRHSCENWVMCRECGMCYKNMDQLEKHYVGTHMFQTQKNTSRCLLCGESINQTPLFHLLSRHTVFAVRLKQEVHLPLMEQSKAFDVLYLDLTKFREVYLCQHCHWIAYDVNGARMHARTSHTSGNFWTVLVSPTVSRVSPVVTGRCSYCNTTTTFQVLMDHLQLNHFQMGRFTCDVCEEYFDTPFDRDYHCLFNHGKRNIESSVQEMNVFSPLNCPLCGICVADSQFMKHLSSHTLNGGPIGHVALAICSVCGVCFINKSEDELNAHSNSHKKSSLEVILAQKRTFFKFRAVDGAVSGTEPPMCDVCDEILMWNASMMIQHVVQKHLRANADALWKYHRNHYKELLTAGSSCRLCIFLNIINENI